MRSVGRRRPRKDDRLSGDAGELETLASKVSYTISPEHKDYLTNAGPGKLRSDATACPRDVDRDRAEGWLRDAIKAGDVSAALEGVFPRYVWTRVDDKVFEARLSNSGLGSYKGYPIEDHEAPGWL